MFFVWTPEEDVLRGITSHSFGHGSCKKRTKGVCFYRLCESFSDDIADPPDHSPEPLTVNVPPTTFMGTSLHISIAMFDYIGININDVFAPKDFYTVLLAPLGYRAVSYPSPKSQFPHLVASFNHDSGSSPLLTRFIIPVPCISHLLQVIVQTWMPFILLD